nr:uncharacterized protein LOC127323403 [Lolium perenne]
MPRRSSHGRSYCGCCLNTVCRAKSISVLPLVRWRRRFEVPAAFLMAEPVLGRPPSALTYCLEEQHPTYSSKPGATQRWCRGMHSPIWIYLDHHIVVPNHSHLGHSLMELDRMANQHGGQNLLATVAGMDNPTCFCPTPFSIWPARQPSPSHVTCYLSKLVALQNMNCTSLGSHEVHKKVQ